MKVTREKSFDNYEQLLSVFGELDVNVKTISETFGVDIITADNAVKIIGKEEAVDKAYRALESLCALAGKQNVSVAQLNMVIDSVNSGEELDIDGMLRPVAITASGKVINPKTLGQRKYVDAIEKNSVVFGVGPAGTGKTYLAVALAVYALKKRKVSKIILTRPAVEAGEKLGFLPGDLNEKVDPYLRPLFDALQDMLGADAHIRLVERGELEIAPLAYMRGRTLSNCFIILDEAQNATKEQMKMFLTRMGENSKVVVTGDVTQIDLPANVTSGMKHAIEVLDGVKGIEVVRLTSKDVVRHELVARIIEAYARFEKNDKNRTQE
ncbi:MAG: PhoH family protein [Clostridia bacterium]|nr:PhoH family protein [Clostridia bacterium]